MALSTEQHYSGGSFLDVDTIIFEEFMERGRYIPNEPDRLEIFYNTIDRKRGETKLWLVGNSISRVCPYINDWGLDKIFRKLQQGQIETKIIHNEENDVKIATLKKGIYDAKEELKRVGDLMKSDLVFFELTPVEFDIQ